MYRYAESVVPTTATKSDKNFASKWIVGINVPLITAASSGFAIIAEPTYARSVNASQRKTFRINSYDPHTCNAKIATVTGMMIKGSGIGIKTAIAAAIPPMSAPASIVFPMRTPIRAGYKIQRE